MKKSSYIFLGVLIVFSVTFISAGKSSGTSAKGERVVPVSTWKQGDTASESILG